MSIRPVGLVIYSHKMTMDILSRPKQIMFETRPKGSCSPVRHCHKRNYKYYFDNILVLCLFTVKRAEIILITVFLHCSKGHG